MERGCRDELVYTRTDDGLLLEGLVIRPTLVEAKPLTVVFMHGLTARFYGPMIVNLGRLLAERGYQFVSGNNRGHDFGSVIWNENNKARLVGGAWERFEESALDVKAWLDFAATLGRPLALAGHSLGALKATYYLAQEVDERVRGLALISPAVRAARLKPELLAQARQMVNEGRGRELLPWGSVPVAGSLSAQTYLNRHQVDLDLYGLSNPQPAVAQVTAPILAFYGTEERWVGGQAELDMIKQHASAAPAVETRMVAGANHQYMGRESEVAGLMAAWLDGLIAD